MNSHSKPYKPIQSGDVKPADSRKSEFAPYASRLHSSRPRNPRSQSIRPRNLKLLSIRLPLPALVSILHRLSGVLLFLSLPAVWWLLALSLDTAAGYTQALAILDSVPVKLLLLGLAWAFIHHFLAGLRHLAMDLHFGLELTQARFTSRLVLAASLLLTLWAGAALW